MAISIIRFKIFKMKSSWVMSDESSSDIPRVKLVARELIVRVSTIEWVSAQSFSKVSFSDESRVSSFWSESTENLSKAPLNSSEILLRLSNWQYISDILALRCESGTRAKNLLKNWYQEVLNKNSCMISNITFCSLAPYQTGLTVVDLVKDIWSQFVALFYIKVPRTCQQRRCNVEKSSNSCGKRTFNSPMISVLHGMWQSFGQSIDFLPILINKYD